MGEGRGDDGVGCLVELRETVFFGVEGLKVEPFIVIVEVILWLSGVVLS